MHPGISKQIINTIKAASDEDGIIPTAGISVGRTQYVNFMSIKQWDTQRRLVDELLGYRDVPGQWADLGGLPRAPPPARPGAASPEMKTSSRGPSFGPATVTSTRTGPRPGAAVRCFSPEFARVSCRT